MENCNSTSNTVCVFDSGIGGLPLFAECVKQYPHTGFVYFADNYNVPYGNLSPEKVLRLTRSAFERIKAFGPSAVVVACNTVTALCIEALRAEYPFPVIGIQPAVKPAVAHGGKCLVLATRATVNSVAFLRLIARYGNADTVVYACSDLAEYIERNVDRYPDIDVCRLLPRVEADGVVLGCTHYAFAANCIRTFYDCPIYDGISGTVDRLGKFLGTADHYCNKKQFIGFEGGNSGKNRAIYYRLLQN